MPTDPHALVYLARRLYRAYMGSEDAWLDDLPAEEALRWLDVADEARHAQGMTTP